MLAPVSSRGGRSRGDSGEVLPRVNRIFRLRLNSSTVDDRHRRQLLAFDLGEGGVHPHLVQAAEDEAAEVIVAEPPEEAGLGPQHGQRRQGVPRRTAPLHAEHAQLQPALVEARGHAQQIDRRQPDAGDHALGRGPVAAALRRGFLGCWLGCLGCRFAGPAPADGARPPEARSGAGVEEGGRRERRGGIIRIIHGFEPRLREDRPCRYR